jgi:pyrroline-5-carboxylate reductase
MGMTVFTCSPDLSRKELFIIQNLLNATGKSLYVEDEKLIDAATAVSGSGPAYVYYFMNSMIKAGVELGFTSCPGRTARKPDIYGFCASAKPQRPYL